MKTTKIKTTKRGHVIINDENDLLCLFGYASKKQANANHKNITKKNS